MTFSSASLQASTERFMLVEIKPRRYLGVGSGAGVNLYSFGTDLERMDEVQIDGVAINSNDWTFDNTTGTVVVYSLNNLNSSTYTVTCDFCVYLTGTKVRDTTAGVSGLPSEIWLPYIARYPQWQQSVRNIGEGVFSISGTDIEVISTDRWIHSKLGDLYSWHKAPVRCWACIDSEENNRLVFSGDIVSASANSTSVTFSVADTFQKLNQTATFGTRAQAYSFTGSSLTPYVNPEDENQPIPLVIGRQSPIVISEGWRHVDVYGSPAATMYHLSDGLKCIKINPQNPSPTGTVDFIAGRFLGTGFATLTFGTMSAAYEHYLSRQVGYVFESPNQSNVDVWEKILYLNCSNQNCQIGDYIPGYGWVCRNTAFTYLAQNYNLAIASRSFYFAGGGTVPASGSISPPSIPDNTYVAFSCWIDGGPGFNYPIEAIDPAALNPYNAYANYSSMYLPATISHTLIATVGNQNVRAALLSIDMSSPYPAIVDPVKFQNASIKCRFSTANSSFGHGEALKFICKTVGLTTDDASFTAADSAYSSDVLMTCPPWKQSENPKYLELAQQITASTFGLLTTNTDNEVVYTLVDDPGTFTSIGTRDSVNMIQGETRAQIEYQDISSEVRYENPAYKGIESLTAGGFSAQSYPITKYLHRIDKEKLIKHVLTTISPRDSVIGKYASSPTVEYTMTTAAEDLASSLSDVIDLDNKVTLQNVETTQGMIVGIDASGEKTSIKVNELRGL